MRKKRCGVYAIKQISTGCWYIGGSVDMVGRFTHHRFVLRRDRHACQALQAAWNKTREEDFEFVELVYCFPETLRSLETMWIRKTNKRFNNIDNAWGFGRTISLDGRRRISHAQLALLTDAERQRRSNRAKQQHAKGNFGWATRQR
jgi:hypothetical protein